MNVFLIAGQPRTRTAWLANFLTYKDSYCFHEAIKACATPQDMRALFEAVQNSSGVRFVGDSDSGIPFIVDGLMDEFPEAKLVVIERNLQDVVRSFKRAFSADDASAALVVKKTQLALERLKKKHVPLVIGFKELASEATVRQLWSHCLPNVPFAQQRWKMLDGFKVEVIAENYLVDFPPEAVQRIGTLIKNYR
ncbi:MAG: hypothetical protein ABI634_08200 [Acidobacteriota bacterium]